MLFDTIGIISGVMESIPTQRLPLSRNIVSQTLVNRKYI